MFKNVPPQQVPAGLKAGQSSATQSIQHSVVSGSCTSASGTFKATVEAFETVTVPAGTFQNAVRLKLEQTESSGGGPSQSFSDTVWLVSGIGIVKEVSPEDGTRVLTFAHVGSTTVGTEGAF